MRYIFAIITLLFFSTTVSAQILTPVKWKTEVKKANGNTYTVHFRASMDPGWHVYAQTQPKNAIARPLEISFQRNPSVVLQGKPREIGRMTKSFDKTTGISSYQYVGKLEVVQMVQVKARAKTTLSGTLTFQTCTGDKCLAPEDVDFEIPLN